MRIRMLAWLGALTSAALLTTHANAEAEPPRHTGDAGSLRVNHDHLAIVDPHGTVVGALASAALHTTRATAHAEPAAIEATASIVDRTVRLHTDAGALRVDHDRLQILDPAGTVVGSLPLALAKQGTMYPIDARIDGNTAVLVPREDQARPLTDAERAEGEQAATAPMRTFDPRPVSDSDSPEDRFNNAMGHVNTELGAAVAVGTLLGAIVGGPLGCVFAGALTTVAAGPVGAVVGCLAGAVVGAGMGVVVFNVLVGVPALIGSAIHFFNVVNAPGATA
ncbi:hypothetical protein [Nocardia sp. CDC160]|uniref:hypothetical protein n=1 Tax=Nocardia sp. CDC160 TaxID=3112166 RepID=UPI002DBF9C19|nr:hypothetical protein [Nocardia sp. CDC160]MEC3916278.1 hypothetical protein [Nocardia sp. CDC160]